MPSPMPSAPPVTTSRPCLKDFYLTWPLYAIAPPVDLASSPIHDAGKLFPCRPVLRFVMINFSPKPLLTMPSVSVRRLVRAEPGRLAMPPHCPSPAFLPEPYARVWKVGVLIPNVNSEQQAAGKNSDRQAIQKVLARGRVTGVGERRY